MAKKKIVWTVDPYAENKQTWAEVIDVLNALKASEWADVVPTYLLGHELIHWIANITPSQVQQLEPVVSKVMDGALKEIKLPGLVEPRIVVSEGLSRREDVQVLANDLANEKASMVIVNTHARSGLDRLFLGSFTETLLLKTEVPVLVVPPGAKVKGIFNKTLIPTSFADSEKKFFTEFVSGEFGFKSDVLLYSKVFHPIDAFAQTASYTLGGGWVSLESYTQDEIARRTSLAEDWVKIGKDNGVNVDVLVEDKPGEFDACLRDTVKAKSMDMVAMPTSASSSEAIFLGSNAREVVRSSEVPVLVRHVKA